MTNSILILDYKLENLLVVYSHQDGSKQPFKRGDGIFLQKFSTGRDCFNQVLANSPPRELCIRHFCTEGRAELLRFTKICAKIISRESVY